MLISSVPSDYSNFADAFWPRLVRFPNCLLITFPFACFRQDRKHGPSISRCTAGSFWHWSIWLAAPHPFAFWIHFFSNYFLMQCVLSLIRDFTSRCRCRFLAFLLRIFPAQQPVTVSRRPWFRLGISVFRRLCCVSFSKKVMGGFSVPSAAWLADVDAVFGRFLWDNRDLIFGGAEISSLFVEKKVFELVMTSWWWHRRLLQKAPPKTIELAMSEMYRRHRCFLAWN